ncbi:L-2-hydroxyglutarate oxidase [Streptomyces halstedii]|uniref:L-2-hydroxyglutarate oxidase n=1 Tax=Streptomyces halstedii TaxID=1944 RepID=UPI00334A9E1C
MRYAIAGAGIVGLAVARRLLLDRPGREVIVLEKEAEVATHQTGHNSGVVHAGLYYTPGSLKATLCRRGGSLLREYAAEHSIPYEEAGKLVVAADAEEERRLRPLYETARANQVPGLALLGPDGLRDIEPEARGRAALHSPHTAVIDFRRVALALARDIRDLGGEVRTGRAVTGVRQDADGVVVTTGPGNTPPAGTGPGGTELRADRLILCGGLHSDRLARLAGGSADPRIVPFRGEYYRLLPERAGLVRGLIYPVPDPRYPFLGVHLTRRIDGTVDVGPNALLSLAREGYRRRDLVPKDLAETLSWPGTLRMAGRHWKAGARQLPGALARGRFAAQARRYVPALEAADLRRAPAGVRAQAVGRDGALIDDFRIETTGRVTAVRNAPSPAATSCLAIAEHITARLADPSLP